MKERNYTEINEEVNEQIVDIESGDETEKKAKLLTRIGDITLKQALLGVGYTVLGVVGVVGIACGVKAATGKKNTTTEETIEVVIESNDNN